eukprot:151699_1
MMIAVIFTDSDDSDEIEYKGRSPMSSFEFCSDPKFNPFGHLSEIDDIRRGLSAECPPIPMEDSPYRIDPRLKALNGIPSSFESNNLAIFRPQSGDLPNLVKDSEFETKDFPPTPKSLPVNGQLQGHIPTHPVGTLGRAREAVRQLTVMIPEDSFQNRHQVYPMTPFPVTPVMSERNSENSDRLNSTNFANAWKQQKSTPPSVSNDSPFPPSSNGFAFPTSRLSVTSSLSSDSLVALRDRMMELQEEYEDNEMGERKPPCNEVSPVAKVSEDFPNPETAEDIFQHTKNASVSGKALSVQQFLGSRIQNNVRMSIDGQEKDMSIPMFDMNAGEDFSSGTAVLLQSPTGGGSGGAGARVETKGCEAAFGSSGARFAAYSAAFLLSFVSFGFLLSFGVLHEELRKDENIGAVKSASIGALSVAVCLFSLVFGGSIQQMLSRQLLVAITGIMFLVSCLTTSFSRNFVLLLLANSIIGGLASAVALRTCLYIRRCFSRTRFGPQLRLATCLGVLGAPIMYTTKALVAINYGISISFTVQGIISLAFLAIAAAQLPTCAPVPESRYVWPDPTEGDQVTQSPVGKVVKCRRFWVLMVACSLMSWTAVYPFMLYQEYFTETFVISQSSASIIISVMLLSLTGGICFTCHLQRDFGDRVLGALSLVAAFCAILITMPTDKSGLITSLPSGIIFGAVLGSMYVIYARILKRTFQKQVTNVLFTSSCLASIPGVLLSSVWISLMISRIDAFKSVGYFGAVPLVISGLVLILARSDLRCMCSLHERDDPDSSLSSESP